jgi:hypothetical protein
LSSRGSFPSSEEIEETTTDDDDDSGGGLVAGEVREIVASFLVGGILTFVGWILGFGIDVIGTVRSGVTSAGAGIANELGKVGGQIIGLLVRTPLEATGDLAAGAWIFAPIVSALIFALVTAMAAAIVYGLWRAIVVIT